MKKKTQMITKNTLIERHTATKMMRVIVIVSFFMVLLVGTVSASWNWDNVKSYDEETRTITITNAFNLPLIGKDIADITLDSSEHVIIGRGEDRKVAWFTINNFNNYKDISNKIEFYDIKNSMKKLDKEFTYKYKKSLGFKTINKTEKVCDYVNWLDVWNCNQVPTKETEQVEEFEWVELDTSKELPKGKITIGVFVTVYPKDHVEWIPTLFGVKISEWAEYSEGEYVSSFDTAANGSDFPYGVTTDGTYIWTPDASDSIIYKWWMNGTFIETWDPEGTDCLLTRGITKDATYFWIGDDTADEVCKYWLNGTYTDIHWDTAASGNEKPKGLEQNETFIWIPDGDEGGIFRYWKNGTYIDFMNTTDDGADEPYGITTNGTYFWVPDWTDDEVYKFWINGTYITKWALNATNIKPVGITHTGGFFYISDYDVDDIFKYGGPVPPDDSPLVTLNSPANDANFMVPTITFNCTASDDINLVNVSLLINGTIEQTNSSGINATEYIFIETVTGGTGFYNWTCQAHDNISQSTIATVRNFTYSNDLAISLNSPVNAYNSTLQTIRFNGTGQDDTSLVNISFILNATYNGTNSSVFNATITNFDRTLADGFYNWTMEACDDIGACVNATARNFTIDSIFPAVNITYPTATIDFKDGATNETLNWTATDLNLDTCWYNYNFINVTVTCNVNTTNFTLTAQRNITFWANDTFGNYNSSYLSWSYLVLQNSQTYNSTSLETKSETFYINITTNGTTPTNGELIYNGTTHSATITSIAGNVYNISETIDVPIVTGNKTFFWNVTIGGTEVSSLSNNQTISLLNFSLCDASLNAKYLNFSFKDEESNTYIDSEIDASTWYYWLGGSTVNKTYTYSTTTNHSNYTFCSSAENNSIKLDMSIQYSTDGFPQRKYDNASTYINSSVMNTILYLLSSGDGQSVTFQVLSVAQQPIAGVYVEAYRTIGGASTLVGSGTTGDDGGVTFWLNPDYSHTLIFTKTGYDTETITVTPTQATYTVTLGGEAIETTTEDYSRGISYSITPTDQVLNLSTNYWFNFTIDSTYWDLDLFGFILTNSTTTLGSDSDTTGTGGTTSLFLNTSSNTTIKMHWYYNIDGNYTNGTKNWWVTNLTDYGYGISTFFTDLKSFTGTAGTEGIFGLNDFSRTLLIFIFIFVVVGMFSYMSGIYSPAALIWMILGLVALFDIGGGMLPSPGVTYFPTILTFLVAIGLTLKEGMK